MEKQVSVVEWLVEQIHSEQYQIAFGQTYLSVELVEQANKMFEDQIKDAYETSHISMMTAEKYFQETFKSE